ncbi:hypothetical protein V1511DRAFT_502638 [Dipodascopsis uninucleata]
MMAASREKDVDAEEDEKDELSAILAEQDVEDGDEELSALLGSEFALGLQPDIGPSSEYIQHADDAIDYGDEDELADEEDDELLSDDDAGKSDDKGSEEDDIASGIGGWGPAAIETAKHELDSMDLQEDDNVKNRSTGGIDEEDEEDEDGGETDEDDWKNDLMPSLRIKREDLSEGDLNFLDNGTENITSLAPSQLIFNSQSLTSMESQESYFSTTQRSDADTTDSTQRIEPSSDAILNTDLMDISTNDLDDHMLVDDMNRAEQTRPLRMMYLFAPPAVKPSLPKPNKVKPCIPTRVNLDADKDQLKLFRSHIRPRGSISNRPGVVHIRRRDVSSRKRQKKTKSDSLTSLDKFQKELIFSCYDWENKIIWDSDSSVMSEEENGPSRKTSKILATLAADNDTFWMDDDEYVSGVDDTAILEGSLEEMARKVVLDLNDSELLVDTSRGERKKNILSTMPIGDQLFHRKYNISNDQAYDLLKENYQSRVRATIGNLNIDHSMVAIRLQSPYYKVKLSKSQARSFHRPNFVVRPNTTIHFSKMRPRKKKKDKGKEISQIFATSKDLSLGDASQYIMFEYSEEYPMVMSNFGMGSKIINYYRKKSNEDDSRPKLNVGETYVLGSQDRSPFWNFGFVEPGEIVPTLYSRLVRAPIFKQEQKNTDFLMIRSTGGGDSQKYYLRSIQHLFTVGQVFPVTEVPSPRSRRVTTASKNRLKMIVYRVLHKSEKERILVKGISNHFPDQNDMQNRQRLKEFMEYQRAGDDQGYWKIKSTDTLPNEDVIRSMVNPEEITLLETMQVGQQFLEDAGYGGGREDDEQHEGMTTEEKLAPWITSKNFINATQGKAMLELHGDGDPSGCGLAFSFIRTSMKGGFKAIGDNTEEKVDKSKFGGHSYNVALQQKAYEEEIARIWQAQKQSLTAPLVEEDSQSKQV